MLIELTLRNLAILSQVRVEFAPGLNVLSGETGAGKSIILHGLGLLLGGRASSEMVRSGEEEAEVVGLFDPEPELLEAVLRLEGEAVAGEAVSIRRVVSAAGRSRAYVGARPVSVQALRELAPLLVDYAGQHEHHVLLEESQHRVMLDRYGELTGEAAAVAMAVGALREVEGRRQALREREADREAREDFLRFQWKELKDANLKEGEEAALVQEKQILANAEKLSREARGAEAALYSGGGSAVERLGEASSRLSVLSGIDPALGAMKDEMTQVLIATEELARSLRDYSRRIEADPQRLEQVQERLGELARLARKHRTDAEGLPSRFAVLDGELRALEQTDSLLLALEGEVVLREKEAMAAAQALSSRRREVSRAMAQAMETELRDLGMNRARLEVVVEPRGQDPSSLDSTGMDRVSFSFSANPGEEPRPLARIASGGELSRILLALKRVLARAARVQTFVFDEIDTGLGGATSEKVGAKMAAIARDGQVLCITHLAPIAAFADAHFLVGKAEEEGRTRTRVERLQGEERVAELARMVGGTQTVASMDLAREMIGRRSGGVAKPGS